MPIKNDLNEIIKNLNREIAKIENKTLDGFKEVAFFIEGEALELTPIDFGLLRNSAFSDVEIQGPSIRARVGYTAEYAPWVHEMPMTLKGKARENFGRTRSGVDFGAGSGKGVYWQGGENKFLEKAIKRNITEILNIIKNEVKIK